MTARTCENGHAVSALQGQTPPRELLDRLHAALLHYCGGKLDDDAALVVRCPDAWARE